LLNLYDLQFNMTNPLMMSARVCLMIFCLFTLHLFSAKAQKWHSLEDQYISDTTSYKNAPFRSFKVFEPDNSIHNGTAILILPGGSYRGLVWEGEGENIARAFNSKGLTCFLLKYRLPSDHSLKGFTEAPLQDAQAALKWIKLNAKNYSLDTNRIGVIGFSAGGHLASTLANHHSGNLAFQILVYPVISMQDDLTHKNSQQALLGENASQDLKNKYSNELTVNQYTPPAYITHTGDDKLVSVNNSIRYYQALLTKKIEAELHLYPKGDHGFLLKLPINEWLNPVTSWLEKNKFIPNRKTVVLTFDDSPASHYHFVAPLLKKYGFGATFYVCEFPKVYPDSSLSLNWRQVRAIANMGFEIGNHTWHHKGVKGIKQNVFVKELVYIEHKCDSLGISKMTSFAYPGYTTDTLAIRILKEKGYTNARTGDEKAYSPKIDDPFYIPSYTIKQDNDQLFYSALQDAKDDNYIVMCFHGVPDQPHPWVSVTEKTFANYISYLLDHNYRVISMKEMMNEVNKK